MKQKTKSLILYYLINKILTVKLCAFFFLLSYSNLNAQKIIENKVDDFTKNRIVSTSYEQLKSKDRIFVKIVSVENKYSLRFKITTDAVIAVGNKDELLFIAENDSILNLRNSEYTISCTGCGAVSIIGSALEGLSLTFNLSSYQVEFLRKNNLKKWRLYTTRGYLEGEIKEKSSDLIRNEILLIDNSIAK